MVATVIKFFKQLSASAIWLVLASGCAFTLSQYPRDPGLADDSPKIYKDTLDSEKNKQTKKPPKPKKNVFFGIKAKKAYTKIAKRKQLTLELFYVLKVPKDPDPYIRDVFWFHTKKKKIYVGPIPEKELPFAKLMHGPYKKVHNKQTIEEGNFYVGTKHGRWVKNQFGPDEFLTDKQRFYKGYPADGEIVYYDVDHKTKVKEIIPYLRKEKHGEYFRFDEKGKLVENGLYEYDVKVGVWREYYSDIRRKIKRQTKYADNAFVKDFKPYVLTEHDLNGVVTYDYEEEQKKKAQKEKKQENVKW